MVWGNWKNNEQGKGISLAAERCTQWEFHVKININLITHLFVKNRFDTVVTTDKDVVLYR